MRAIRHHRQIPGGLERRKRELALRESQPMLPEVEVEVGDSSDIELTPAEVFGPVLDALGREEFDLDPCSHALALVPAVRRIHPPSDGLSSEWSGLVWLNPPYSKPYDWCDRASRCDAVGLLRVDTTAAWWKDTIWKRAGAVLFLADRVAFIKPGRPDRPNAMFSSALVFWGRTADFAGDLAGLGAVVEIGDAFETEHQADARAIAERLWQEGNGS